jgi:hypothetical protein
MLVDPTGHVWSDSGPAFKESVANSEKPGHGPTRCPMQFWRDDWPCQGAIGASDPGSTVGAAGPGIGPFAPIGMAAGGLGPIRGVNNGTARKLGVSRQQLREAVERAKQNSRPRVPPRDEVSFDENGNIIWDRTGEIIGNVHYGGD